MLTRKEFNRKWPKFKQWLLDNGSAIYEPTNRYEAARFLTDCGIGVIYSNSSDRISSFVNGASEAWEAYQSAKPWRAVEKTVRSKKTEQEYRSLVARDGNCCLYCNAELSCDTATIEHLIPVSSGGSNHMQNKALACHGCNQAAGNLSVRQKIEMAIARRFK
jgi:5-methylcytosine-specific restriction endonuclease McrA